MTRVRNISPTVQPAASLIESVIFSVMVEIIVLFRKIGPVLFACNFESVLFAN
jgi:hypothetical protein